MFGYNSFAHEGAGEKTRLSRSESRKVDGPVGDPTGGAAYGQKSDVGSVVSGAASIYSANKQADAARDAANMSAAGSDAALKLQSQMYNQNRADQAPWLAAGQSALGYLTQGIGSNGMNGDLTRSFKMSDYQADPGYAFRQSEGQKALERSAAARGGLYSGRAAKDLTRFAQDTASNEYGNAYNRFNNDQTTKFNRLSSLAGLGQNANNANAASGSNYANSATNTMMTNAANQGNSAISAANAMASGYNGLASAVGRYW